MVFHGIVHLLPYLQNSSLARGRFPRRLVSSFIWDSYFRTRPILDRNRHCFLCLGFFSLEPFLQHLRLSSAPFCSPRWLELFRLRDRSAQSHCRAISILIVPLPVSILLASDLCSQSV